MAPSYLPILPIILAGLSVASFAFASSAPSQSEPWGSSNITTGFTNISTNNPSSCPHPTKYFRQLIDHGSNATQDNTFLQQYQVVSDYWKPGGPILFYQGAEDPEIACLEYLSLPTYAKELNALVVGIEHRYFGESVPYGLNTNDTAHWTLKQWNSLTLDNVLADSVTLLDALKRSLPGLSDSKAISFGGSYGALLAGSLRIKYPEHFYGAISSCGVQNGMDTNPNSSWPYAYAAQTSNVFADISAEAAVIIRDGLNAVRSLMEKGDFDTVSAGLNFCEPPTSTNQTEAVLLGILTAYQTTAQIAFSPPQLSTKPPFNEVVPPHSLLALINETLAAPSPLAAVNAAVSQNLARLQESCFDPVTNSQGLDASDQLGYIICTYLPYPYDNLANAQSIFGMIGSVDPSSPNTNDAYCQKTFGINAKKGDLKYRQELGISQDQASAQTRMFFTLGQYDPTTVLGLNSWVSSADRNDARWWLAGETGHTEDMLAPTEYDTQGLRDTRAAELSYMQYWLGMEG